mgnify:FL=1
MRVDNEKELEMNECEKIANELIEEKEKVNFNFEDCFTYILIILVIGVVIILTFYLKELIFEITFILAVLGTLFSSFLALIFTVIIEFSLKTKRKLNLKNDKEYQVAKEVMLNYQIKVFEFNENELLKIKKDRYKTVLDKEVEKMGRISKLENYLKKEINRNDR